MEYAKELAIIINSWDGSQELWNPMEECLKLNWKDCPFQLFLTTQDSKPDYDTNFKIISIPDGNKRPIFKLNEAIKKIDTKYICLICDHFFFMSNVNTLGLYSVIDYMNENSVDLIKLLYSKTRKITLCDYSKNFIISTAIPCIYNRNFLIKLLDNCNQNANIRTFEIQGTNYLKNNMNLGLIKNYYTSCIKLDHAVLEGFWRTKPYRYCKKNNITITFSTYKHPTILHSIYAVIKASLFNLINIFFPKIYNIYSNKVYR